MRRMPRADGMPSSLPWMQTQVPHVILACSTSAHFGLCHSRSSHQPRLHATRHTAQQVRQCYRYSHMRQQYSLWFVLGSSDICATPALEGEVRLLALLTRDPSLKLLGVALVQVGQDTLVGAARLIPAPISAFNAPRSECAKFHTSPRPLASCGSHSQSDQARPAP